MPANGTLEPMRAPRRGPGLRRITWLALGFESILLGVAVALGWLVGNPPFRGSHFGMPAVAGGVAATIPLLLLMRWSVLSRWAPAARFSREVEARLLPLFAGCSTLDLVIVSVAAGVGEEALFRGVIQVGLADRFGPLAGLTAASALFGLAHMVSPLYALLAGLVGAYLGGLTLAAGNLVPAILAHALYDFLALSYLLRRHRRKQAAAAVKTTDR